MLGIDIEGIYIHAKLNDEDIYFDKTGNQISNIKYSSVNETRNDNYYITIDNEGFYGVINKNEDILIDNKYKYLEYAYEDYFIAYNNQNKLGVIDKSGNKVVEFKYDVLSKLEKSNIIEGRIIAKGIIDLYSKQMSIIDSFEKIIISEQENYIELYNGEFVKFIDKDGNDLDIKQIFTNQKLYEVEKNGKYGFCDSEGNIKVECIYDGVTAFNKYGYAGIKKNGKWGSIDENGEVVQNPIYNLNDTEIIPNFIGNYYRVEYEYGQTYYTNAVVE